MITIKVNSKQIWNELCELATTKTGFLFMNNGIWNLNSNKFYIP